MLPLKTKITIYLLVAISHVIGYVSGQAGWYRDCLNVSKSMGYKIVFLPTIVFLIVAVLLGIGILPWSLTDEVYGLATLLSAALVMLAAYRQVRGQCSPSCSTD